MSIQFVLSRAVEPGERVEQFNEGIVVLTIQ